MKRLLTAICTAIAFMASFAFVAFVMLGGMRLFEEYVSPKYGAEIFAFGLMFLAITALVYFGPEYRENDNGR